MFHLGKGLKIRCGSSLIFNCLFAHLGTGVVRSSIAEVPHSPISSSVPTAERNATLPRIQTLPHSTNVGVRPFSPSKTATSSHNSNTPGGNAYSLFLSSYLLCSYTSSATEDKVLAFFSHTVHAERLSSSLALSSFTISYSTYALYALPHVLGVHFTPSPQAAVASPGSGSLT